MDIKRPIFWHQGLFLQPQHFQLADQHARHLLQPLMQHGLPHFWGVADLEVSSTAVGNRVVEVTRASVVFRDGTHCEFPGNSVLKPRSFEGAWQQGDKPFMVYLGVKKLSPVENNVAVVRELAESGAAEARFVTTAAPEEVRDLYQNGPVAQVKSLSFVLRLFWESETEGLDDYELLPIARLERDGDFVKISERYIPPCVCLGGSAALGRMVQEVRDEIAGRTRQLEEYKSPREMQKAEFDASYMVYLLALRTLNRYAPLLYHFSETRQAHPWAVYGALRQMVGELSSFSERYNMLGEPEDGGAGLPAYDHLDPGRCLAAAQALVVQLLNEITIGPEFLVRLERQPDGILSSDLPRTFFGARSRFYLVMRTETDLDQALASFQTEAILAARDALPGLINRALPGVELIHMPVAPQGLPRRSYSLYFRIEQMSEDWLRVEKEANAALYWAHAPEDLKAEIVVLRR